MKHAKWTEFYTSHLNIKVAGLTLLSLALLAVGRVSAQTETDLNTTDTTGGTLTVNQDIAVTTPLSIQTSGTVTINGNGHNIDGGGASSGFFVEGGSLTISNANLNNFSATGGTGSGGGAALGGALFVNAGTTVTLNSVNFTSNTVTGGTGGIGTIGGSLNNLFSTPVAAAGANGANSPAGTAFANDGNGGNGYNGVIGTAGGGTGGNGGNGGNGSAGTGVSAQGAYEQAKFLADTEEANEDEAEAATLEGEAATEEAKAADEETQAAELTAEAGSDTAEATEDGVEAADDTALSVTEIVDGAADAAAGAEFTDAAVAATTAAGAEAEGIEEAVLAGDETAITVTEGSIAGEEASIATEEGTVGAADTAEQGELEEQATEEEAKSTSEATEAAADEALIVATQVAGLADGVIGTGGDGGYGGQGAAGSFGYGGGSGGNGGDGGDAALISASIGGGGGDGGNGGFGGGGGSGGNGGMGGSNPSDTGLNGSETGSTGGGGDGGDTQNVSGGFGGGVGNSGTGFENVGGNGGGGGGMGGAIFVRAGGTLLITGNSTFAGNQTNAGLSVDGGAPGESYGTDLFMMTGSSVTLDPGPGNTITFNGSIADDSVATIGYPAGNGQGFIAAGAGAGLTIENGTVVLNGSDSYSGVTSVTSGGILVAVDGTGLPGTSNLELSGAGILGGIFESTGSLDRFLGTLGGEIQFAGSGGFASNGTLGDGGLTVTINNNAPLTFGQLHFVGTNQDLIFGETNATDTVTFTNPLNLGGLNRQFLVVANSDDTDTATLLGVISNGAVTVNDGTQTGTLILTNHETYTGGTTIESGTLALSGPGASLVATSAVVDNGTFDISGSKNQVIGDLSGSNAAGFVNLGSFSLTIGTANSTTYAGVIEDGGLNGGIGGSLIKQGAGIFTLTNANTYTGGTMINGGILALSGGGSLAAAGTVQDNGHIFDISQATGNQTIGSLAGSGTVFLGANKLATGADNASTTFSGSIVDGGIGNGIGGSLDKQGTGVFTLSGVNTYTGGTTIDGGTLALALGGSLDPNGSVVDNGAVFDISQTTAGFQEIGDLSGSGTVALGSKQLMTGGDNASTTFSGVIQDAGIGAGTGGSIAKMGTGVFTLSGANTYTGGTLIDGGTLALSGAGSLYSMGSVNDMGFAFDISQATGNETIGDLSGSGVVSLGANKLITGGDNASTTFAGNIVDGGIGNGTGGSLDKQGTGVFTLSGANTYTGGSTIDGGTLALALGGSLNPNGSVTDNGAVFDISQTTAGFQDIGDLSGSGTVALGSKLLMTGGDNASTTFSGVIQDAGIGAGTGGSVAKMGTGVFTLTGANTYTGGTLIDGGTLALKGAGTLYSLGSVNDLGSIFDISQATGNQTIGDLGGSGTVNLGANKLTTGGDNASTTFGGAISDGGIGNGAGGSLDKEGTGLFVLTGTNTYTGSTTIGGGTLQLGNGGATGTINDTTVVNDNGTFIFDLNNSNTFPQVIQGTGMLGQIGSGTTILTGTDTYTGGTIITNGTLQVSNGGTAGSIGGSILDDGSFVTDLSSNFQLNGLITGTGSVTQQGTGMVTITGNNSFNGYTQTAGTTTVGNVNALGSGNVAINNGTIQFATGTHTLAVGGTFTLGNTGTFIENIDATGPEQITAAQGAVLTGTLQVNLTNGFTPVGVVTITLLTTPTGTPLITSSGGHTLTLAPVSSSNPLVAYVGTYQVVPDPILEIILTEQFVVGPGSGSGSGSGGSGSGGSGSGGSSSGPGAAGESLTPNQRATLGPINQALLNLNTNPQFTALVNGLTIATLTSFSAYTNALDQLNDDKFAQFADVNQINNASFFVQNLDTYLDGKHGPDGMFHSSYGIDASGLTYNGAGMDPTLSQVQSHLLAWNPAPVSTGLLSDSTPADAVDVAPSEPSTRWNTFVAGNAIFADDASSADVPHASSTTGSVQVGADYLVTPHILVGVVMGYGYTDATLDSMGSKATVDSYTPGVYASYLDGGAYVNALATYGYDEFSENRQISFGGFSAATHGDPNGNQELGDLDGGYDFHRGSLTFGPTLGVQYLHLNVDSFTESGGGITDLAVQSQNQDSLRGRIGGRFSYAFKAGDICLTPHLNASWQHEFLSQDTAITSQFDGLGAGSFNISTPDSSRNSALVDLGMDTDINRNVTVFVDYLAQAGQGNYFGQSAQAGVKIGF